jgi:hypothetical protein
VPTRADPALRMPRIGVAQTDLAAFDHLAAELEAQLRPLAAAALARVREKAPAPERGGEAGVGQIDELLRESLRAQLRSFRRGSLPDCCPEVDVEAVARLLRPADLRLLETAYRASQAVLWDAWFELIEAVPELPLARRRELLRRGSDFFFRYADLQGDHVAEVGRRRLERRSAGTEQRRFRAIKGLLDGDPAAAPLPDFDLGRHHLALIAWGEEPRALARRLAEELGRPLLSVTPLERPGSCWAWISGTRPLDAAAEHRLAGFRPAAGRLALGLEGFGEAGFRAGHRQAQRARRFAPQPGPALVRYEEVVVEALACENEDDARAFVAHELRGIEDDSSVSRRIRETLAAYFAAEYNAASAAATLGVHQQTVANRLRAAEERLGGRPIAARRVELEMALRLRGVLGEFPDPGPTRA